LIERAAAANANAAAAGAAGLRARSPGNWLCASLSFPRTARNLHPFRSERRHRTGDVPLMLMRICGRGALPRHNVNK